jgi:hypothetical protein
VVEEAIKQAYVTAQYDRGISLISHLNSIVGGRLPQDMGQRLVSLLVLKEHATQLRMEENDILDRLIVARQAVINFGLDAVWETRSQLRDGTFITYYHLDADRATCSECTFAIFDALGDQFKETGMELFSIMCLPLEDYSGPILQLKS